MDKKLLVFAFLFISFSSFSQISFGVSPGLSLNTMYVGYKVNSKFTPFFGFQYISTFYTYERSGTRFNNITSAAESYTNEDKFTASVYIPNLGTKYYVKELNKLKSYFLISVAKPILTAKFTENGDVDDRFKDEVKKVSLWGGEFAFGTEYFFDENFSIGGEFGLRYLRFKYIDSYDSSYYDNNLNTSVPSTVENKLVLQASPTYSKIALNFYF